MILWQKICSPLRNKHDALKNAVVSLMLNDKECGFGEIDNVVTFPCKILPDGIRKRIHSFIRMNVCLYTKKGNIAVPIKVTQEGT